MSSQQQLINLLAKLRGFVPQDGTINVTGEVFTLNPASSALLEEIDAVLATVKGE